MSHGNAGLNFYVILIMVGALILVVGKLMFLVAAFRESAGWGVCCLIVPLASLFFMLFHWDEAKKPLLIWLIGGVVLCFGGLLGGYIPVHP